MKSYILNYIYFLNSEKILSIYDTINSEKFEYNIGLIKEHENIIKKV